MRRMIRISGILAIMAVLATSAYAFTAANTVPASSAGFGAGDISGYVVSNISYGLDGDASSDTFGNNIETVSFDIAGTNMPTEVTVWFDDSTAAQPPTNFYSVQNGDCFVTGAASPWQVDCNVDQFAADIEQLRIGAAQ